MFPKVVRSNARASKRGAPCNVQWCPTHPAVGGTLSTFDGSTLWDTRRRLDPSIGVHLNQSRSMARAVQIE